MLENKFFRSFTAKSIDSVHRKWIILLFFGLFIFSCSSYKQFQYLSEEFEIPSQVYMSDYNQSWQAVVQVMKKYDLAYHNQEAGVIKTRWIDNTIELNFADSFGNNDSVKSAKFKIILNIVKGFRGSREVSKITVYKRQLVEQDFLQGWKEIPTDGILEKTILYRIERVIAIDNKLKKIEEKKGQEVEETF
jgi:hypothetical protein